MSTESEAIISQHEANGKYVTIEGIKTFYLDAGTGPVVFCIHGVPTSSFLYRKVVDQLQKKGLRAIAIDLPGLGLSDKPEDFDYIFSNFGRFCNQFLDALDINEAHLLVHDIGGPIGFSMANQNSDRIRSITVLNAMLDLENFVKPLPFRPFEKPILGEAALAMLTPTTFPLMMNMAGVVNNDVISSEETGAYIHLLKREDDGKAFLKIMRNFDQSSAFTRDCYRAWQNPAYPVQLVWGEEDPFLKFEEHGKSFEDARPGIPVTKVNSKHFLQEEQYEIIATKVKELIPEVDFSSDLG
ncbi:alpha/beta fold hydrolase [Algoriphagus antarcticus]|uniref:Pimeloyl-ACP methyl ester carboxylesterase n=1 Tax=Algoriphagus antarcticus TaxID=238540 RepID=A0A3E0E2W3_9BACT|nr:alpha/beta fold hydrolase [Algoriphagus antarcticus]REG92614.1 pimeloyl-ACP methyl ester carboxylesterase [Algoriphagus antarcticus]